MMIKNVELTNTQRMLVKRICKQQINALQCILEQNTDIDITMYCINEDISHEGLNFNVKKDKALYEDIYKNPQSILSLEEEDLCIVKTILANFVIKEKNKKSIAGLWKKFNARERFAMYYSPN